MSKEKEYMNVTQLPESTRKQVIWKHLIDVRSGRLEGIEVGLNLSQLPPSGTIKERNFTSIKVDSDKTSGEIKGLVNQIFNTYPQDRTYIRAFMLCGVLMIGLIEVNKED